MDLVHLDDLFAPTGMDEWFQPVDEPRMEVIRNLIAGPLTDDDDLETAVSLARLVHAELEEFWTSAQVQRLNNDQIVVAQRALRATLGRQGIELNLPWRDYSSFCSYWINQGASGGGGWQGRRDILAGFFDHVFVELGRLEDAWFAATLADPVSPAGRTGWEAVDYSDVARRCVAVMDALSRTVYDPGRHLPADETEPPAAQTHKRIMRFVEVELEGSGNVEIRALVRKTAELAEAVKHRGGATRRDAGIAADTAILLANLLRRIDSS